jgi:hypothetical protein
VDNDRYQDKEKGSKDKKGKTTLGHNLKPVEINRLAWLELNLLHYSRSLGPVNLEGARLETSTPVYDSNGELLFHRFPLVHGDTSAGYADVAAHTALGAPLLAVAPTAVWDERGVLAQAQEAFRRRAAEQDRAKSQTYDELRFVAYSFPKIAVQFLQNKKEVAMLECFTWIPVPTANPRNRKKLEAEHFERWSLLDELPEDRKRDNHRNFQERTAAFGQLQPVTATLSRQLLQPQISILQLTRSHEIHYSGRAADHHVCYELRGQETNVWCVGASTQMVLDFYRYNYSQVRIAQQLGLGTLANPTGLPYVRVGDVVTQLQVMSSNALTAHMITGPVFSDFVSELDQNRPMISFIPGHSRTVAGYTESLLFILGHLGFRGLLVYDPWPPNAGVITRWENFDTQTYQYAYSARVSTI